MSPMQSDDATGREGSSPALLRTAEAPKLSEIGIALATGGLLTFMLLCNGIVAAHTTPLFASLAAHGIGTCVAALAIVFIWWKKRRPTSPRLPSFHRRAPFWAYLGGVSGAVTVMLTSWTVNSPLALTGTLALGLAGQLVLALIFDCIGALGLKQRLPRLNDLLALAAIVAGTTLIIMSRAVG